MAASMLFTLQRYEFLSKSQQYDRTWSYSYDVIYLTKVRIFKQITTWKEGLQNSSWMLFTLQRYEFLSKSQQDDDHFGGRAWCYLPYKGTNF